MRTNSLLIGALALASMAFAAGKTYEVTISKASKAGAVTLAPGTYKLKVDGTTAVFTDSKNKSFSTAVKVETAAKKYSNTSVDSSDGGATELIHSIRLAGSMTQVDFEAASTGNN